MYKLIAGLGNPGERYKNTRHNLGFMAIDEIALKLNVMQFVNKFHAEFISLQVGNYKILLLKPQTFMNNSGTAIRECANFYKILPQDILVIHDELDLETGKIKIKIGGGSGGHNGLKSIDQNIGNNYYRLRFGVGKPEHKSQVSDYVLHNFNSNEIKIVSQGLKFISNNLGLLLNSNYDNFLNNYANELKKNVEQK
ncbi:peptidyl-tRNA hydrolase [endosymbiont of Acanthamoeba sp. UWC8]|uniref:aminoacyl-tRNA hydrolase n=1 Tax=endosymbiont of Acanthamoeba sp. UWC8 TaxID=86106 RepID=UPI0004D17F3F|nr:aminoacyl-tRNA hydrolase [endosymbiont of Acanthamoeba sp. UWC8]AIF81077.1 peptidyl-tRNA hydrolase [endosymbiont of Acanthamoeba sp. UWC8]